ncbi:sensor histidine kinase [Paenibacillus sp. FSL H7-0714]|uniref:sensor histidine kinase n=1 Tax=Paenibacillus sp. FSL H7-0714 TaxID=2954735 RepID=UPI0030FB2078
MKKFKLSMSVKLFFICFLFVLATATIVSQISLRYLQKEMYNSQRFYEQQMISKVNQNLSLSFESYQNILFSIDSIFPFERRVVESLKSHLSKLVDLNRNFVSNIYIIKDDMSIVGGNILTTVLDEPREERRSLYEQALDNNKSTVISNLYKSSTSGWTVTLLKYLRGSNPSAVIAVDLDLSAIDQNLLKMIRDDLMNMIIVDSQGLVIAGESGLADIAFQTADRQFSFGDIETKQIAAMNENTMNTKDRRGSPIMLSRMPTSKFNWSIISINTGVRLKKSELQLQRNFSYLLIVGVVLSIIVAIVITRYIRKPLLYLTSKMKLIRLGQLDMSSTWNRNDEFGELAKTIDIMQKEIRLLLDNLNASNELKRELEIQVLQSQINPHFLYNTLGSIANVVGLEQYDKVDPMIRALINTLEYGIADASSKVTLQEELNNVRDYIFIQNVRYNHTFVVWEHIEEGLEQFPVFRLLLQPIVENSLFHGYSGGRKTGPIIIKAYKQEDCIFIEVIDEGVGMSNAIASSILQKVIDKTKMTRQRIGLANIHQRIKLYYGKSYGLIIMSREGKGSCVRAVFPLHETE